MPSSESRKKAQESYRELHREEINARNRERYAADPQKRLDASRKSRAAHPDTRLRYTLQKLYGITLEKYRDLETKQGHRCAICQQPPGRRRLAVDHDHSTGEVRALLCGQCNRMIGYARENPEIMRLAAKYIEDFRYISRKDQPT